MYVINRVYIIKTDKGNFSILPTTFGKRLVRHIRYNRPKILTYNRRNITSFLNKLNVKIIDEVPLYKKENVTEPKFLDFIIKNAFMN